MNKSVSVAYLKQLEEQNNDEMFQKVLAYIARVTKEIIDGDYTQLIEWKVLFTENLSSFTKNEQEAMFKTLNNTINENSTDDGQSFLMLGYLSTFQNYPFPQEPKALEVAQQEAWGYFSESSSQGNFMATSALAVFSCDIYCSYDKKENLHKGLTVEETTKRQHYYTLNTIYNYNAYTQGSSMAAWRIASFQEEKITLNAEKIKSSISIFGDVKVKEDNVQAFIHLANIYLSEEMIEVEDNKEKGIALYKKAVSKGSIEAKIHLALQYCSQLPSGEDTSSRAEEYQQGLRWLQELQAFGYLTATAQLNSIEDRSLRISNEIRHSLIKNFEYINSRKKIINSSEIFQSFTFTQERLKSSENTALKTAEAMGVSSRIEYLQTIWSMLINKRTLSSVSIQILQSIEPVILGIVLSIQISDDIKADILNKYSCCSGELFDYQKTCKFLELNHKEYFYDMCTKGLLRMPTGSKYLTPEELGPEEERARYKRSKASAVDESSHLVSQTSTNTVITFNTIQSLNNSQNGKVIKALLLPDPSSAESSLLPMLDDQQIDTLIEGKYAFLGSKVSTHAKCFFVFSGRKEAARLPELTDEFRCIVVITLEEFNALNMTENSTLYKKYSFLIIYPHENITGDTVKISSIIERRRAALLVSRYFSLENPIVFMDDNIEEVTIKSESMDIYKLMECELEGKRIPFVSIDIDKKTPVISHMKAGGKVTMIDFPEVDIRFPGEALYSLMPEDSTVCGEDYRMYILIQQVFKSLPTVQTGRAERYKEYFFSIESTLMPIDIVSLTKSTYAQSSAAKSGVRLAEYSKFQLIHPKIRLLIEAECLHEIDKGDDYFKRESCRQLMLYRESKNRLLAKLNLSNVANAREKTELFLPIDTPENNFTSVLDHIFKMMLPEASGNPSCAIQLMKHQSAALESLKIHMQEGSFNEATFGLATAPCVRLVGT